MTSCQINILLFLYFSVTFLISNLLMFKALREDEEELERLKKIVVECCFGRER